MSPRDSLSTQHTTGGQSSPKCGLVWTWLQTVISDFNQPTKKNSNMIINWHWIGQTYPILMMTCPLITNTVCILRLFFHRFACFSLLRLVSSLQDLICRTDECLEASGAIISQMNMSVDPCVNFYEYACGGFVEREFMRPAQSHTNQFSLMQTSNSEVLYQVRV